MRDYGKVVPRFWTQGSGKKLRGDALAQVVALYLFTCPSASMTGLYYLPIAILAHEVGSPFEGASKALRRVCEAGIAQYDPEAEVVWIPEMARIQIGETIHPKDRRGIGVERELAPYANHPFVNLFLEKYGVAYNLKLAPNSNPLRSPFEAPTQPPSKPPRSQEQEQEQEQEQDQIPPVCVDPDPGSTARANPTSTHTEGGVTPESLLADVRRYPSLCALAEDERAITDMAYAAAISGMTAVGAGEAVAAFSIARAAEIPSMSNEALKRALGGFLARQRSGGNGRAKPEPMDPDVRQCVDDFRAAWGKSHGGRVLPPSSGDGRHAGDVVRLAREASMLAGVKARPSEIWRHVMRGYCADGDQMLMDQAHPIALLPSRFSRYGMPGGRAALAALKESAPLPGPRKLPPGLAPGPGMTPDEIARAARAIK